MRSFLPRGESGIDHSLIRTAETAEAGMTDQSSYAASDASVQSDQSNVEDAQTESQQRSSKSPVRDPSSSKKTQGKRGNFRLPKLLTPKKTKPKRVVQPEAKSVTQKGRPIPSSSGSVASDCATAESYEAAKSVHSIISTANSVGTNVTIKTSNRYSVTAEPTSPSKNKNPWNKFKKMITKKEEESNATDSHARARALSYEPSPSRSKSKRIRSEAERKELQLLDDAIRGRMDGMDVLSLGSARVSSIRKSSIPQEGKMSRRTTTPLDMVTDMLYTSGGKEPPEMILEGFLPAGDDRWVVRMEKSKQPTGAELKTNSGESVPSLQVTDDEESADCDVDKLMESMWGNEYTPPTHRSRSSCDSAEGNEQDILKLAAECSVPIDLDEATFMVDTAAHLESVHSIASGPLKEGRFDVALGILNKILKGLELRHENEPHYLIGSTLYNIGVIQMWQGKYEDSLVSLERAVANRIDSLPPKHPAIAVSLSREAMVLFALNRLDDALASLEKALKVYPELNSTRASILNNQGVVQFQRQDFVGALIAFSSALDIQRGLLEGQVRRDRIVFDSSITLSNLGKLYLERKDYSMAVFVYEEALLLRTTSFRKDHDIVLSSLSNLAYAKAKEGKSENALKLYEGLLRSQETRFGPNSHQAAETTGLMASVYIKMRKYEEAKVCLRKVITWQEAHLPPGHPFLRHSRLSYKKLEEKEVSPIEI